MARYPSPKPAEAPEANEQPQEAPKQAAPKITVRPVYGRMVHQITAQELDGDTVVPEIDGWLQAQIDAGKVVVVK